MTRGRKKKPQRGNGFPYFRAWAGDWLSSSTRARLTPEQRGAFWDLIFYEWNSPDCLLPADPLVLAAYSGLGDRWADVGAPMLAIAFKKRGEKFYNARLMKERKYVEARSLKASKAGVKSGLARR